MKTAGQKFIILMMVFLVNMASFMVTLRFVINKVPIRTSMDKDDQMQCSKWLAAMILFALLVIAGCIHYLKTQKLPLSSTITERLLRFFAWLFLLPLIGEILLSILLLFVVNG